MCGQGQSVPKKADLHLLNSVLFNALLVYKTLHQNQNAKNIKVLGLLNKGANNLHFCCFYVLTLYTQGLSGK
jgi:hypothetical protein